MSGLLALAVSGVQENGETLSQTPDTAVQTQTDSGTWIDTGALIETEIPVVTVDPVVMESPETDQIHEYAEKIAKDAAEVRVISEQTKKDAGLKGGPGFAPPMDHEACNCECPRLDEIRRVIREELDRPRQNQASNGRSVQATTSSVTIFTRPNCPPCDQWKMQVMPGLIAAGWKVIEKPAAANLSSPYFQICTNGQCQEFQGYLSMGQMNSIVDRIRAPKLFPNLRR